MKFFSQQSCKDATKAWKQDSSQKNPIVCVPWTIPHISIYTTSLGNDTQSYDFENNLYNAAWQTDTPTSDVVPGFHIHRTANWTTLFGILI